MCSFFRKPKKVILDLSQKLAFLTAILFLTGCSLDGESDPMRGLHTVSFFFENHVNSLFKTSIPASSSQEGRLCSYPEIVKSNVSNLFNVFIINESSKDTLIYNNVRFGRFDVELKNDDYQVLVTNHPTLDLPQQAEQIFVYAYYRLQKNNLVSKRHAIEIVNPYAQIQVNRNFNQEGFNPRINSKPLQNIKEEWFTTYVLRKDKTAEIHAVNALGLTEKVKVPLDQGMTAVVYWCPHPGGRYRLLYDMKVTPIEYLIN